jgi:hypothetical protein
MMMMMIIILRVGCGGVLVCIGKLRMRGRCEALILRRQESWKDGGAIEVSEGGGMHD